MKIEDRIYIPHICPECNTARLIPRDDLHDQPKIICSECGGVMRRWVVYKEAPQPRFSDETFDLLTYTQKRRKITGSPWFAVSGGLADARRKVKQDLVDDPGLLDIIVTLVCEIIYMTQGGDKTLRIESVPYSQLHGRIQELHDTVVDGKVRVWIAYSEETSQVFVLNGLEIDEPPRLPGYDVKYDKKRTGIRTPASGVLK